MIQINRQLLTNPLTRPALRAKNGSAYQLKAVRAIVAHWTANTNKGAHAMANRNYFNNGSPGPGGTFRSASAHYCVDSTQIVQCLPDNEVGFHVGGVKYRPDGIRLMSGYKNVTPNYFTIGFEMCVNADGDWLKTYAYSIELAAYLLKRHGLSTDNLLRHYDITGKDCPKMLLEEVQWQSFKWYVGRQLLQWENLPVAEVMTDRLNVRSGPSVDKGVIRSIDKGERVILFDVRPDGWAQIEQNQFINTKYVQWLEL